jgi:hypothetical protein
VLLHHDQIPKFHGRMAREGHGLSKVLLGLTMRIYMPDRSKPCRRATPETGLQPIQRWPARMAGGLRSSSTPSDTPRHKLLSIPKTTE